MNGPRRNPTKRAALDRDANTITLAVTFKWRRPWALDKCEAGFLPRAVYRAIVDATREGGPLADCCQIEALESIRSWDPAEEVELGRFLTPIPLDTDKE